MLFKSATIMPFTEAYSKDLEFLEAALTKNKFVPCEGVEESRCGWIPPSRREDGEIMLAMGSAVLFCLQREEKILPAAVIAEEVRSVVEIRERDGHRVGSKELNKIKEDVRFNLLPKAFSKYTRTFGYIDYQRQELIINTNSDSKAEEFQIYLRKATESLPVTFLKTEISIPMLLTDWLSGEKPMPEKLSLGENIALKDESEGGTATFRKQDLRADEVIQCVNSGKLVKEIDLEWNDYLLFAIDEKGHIKKLKAADMFNLSYEGELSREENYTSLESDFYLTFEALRTLIPLFRKWFQFKEQEHTMGMTPEEIKLKFSGENPDYGRSGGLEGWSIQVGEDEVESDDADGSDDLDSEAPTYKDDLSMLDIEKDLDALSGSGDDDFNSTIDSEY